MHSLVSIMHYRHFHSAVMFFKADVIVILALALAFVIQVSHGYDVLMVVGGMYVENSIGYTLKAVEVIGLNSVCQVHKYCILHSQKQL